MDLRIHKTRQAIREAFLALRWTKDLEQITVKELCHQARISKGTFYLHYRDLFDLSDQLQRDAIREMLALIPDPLEILSDLPQFMEKLRAVMEAESATIEPLFAGPQRIQLPVLLEQEMKELIFALHPEYRNDVQVNVILPYHVFGGFYTYLENLPRFGSDAVLQVISQAHRSAPRSLRKSR